MTGQTGYTLNNVTTAVIKTGNSVNSTVTFSNCSLPASISPRRPPRSTPSPPAC